MGVQGRANLGTGVIFLTDTNDENWTATSGDEDLDRTQSGWGNAFELPSGDEAPLELEFPRSLMDYGWLVALPLLWLFMIGAAFPSRRGEKRRAQA